LRSHRLRLDPALPLGGALLPLVLRDQVAAALYVDQPSVNDRLDLEPLQVLAFVAAQSIELLAFRQRPSTPRSAWPRKPPASPVSPCGSGGRAGHGARSARGEGRAGARGGG